jgi:hypothetical protein
MRLRSKRPGDLVMAGKRPLQTSIVKRLGIAGMVVCVVGLGFWVATDEALNPLFLCPLVAGVFAITFWALGEQYMFSFGKSRYLTRTEKKRLRHQRKKGDNQPPKPHDPSADDS